MTEPMSITDLSSIRTIVCEHCGSNVPDQPKILQHPRAPLTLSQSEAAE